MNSPEIRTAINAIYNGYLATSGNTQREVAALLTVAHVVAVVATPKTKETASKKSAADKAKLGKMIAEIQKEIDAK